MQCVVTTSLKPWGQGRSRGVKCGRDAVYLVGRWPRTPHGHYALKLLSDGNTFGRLYGDGSLWVLGAAGLRRVG